ncbi:hypothetical protein Tco_0356591 [Tanacetum coccineum]
MDQDSAHMVAASKVPMLKPGEFELWRMRIEQYIQMIDYALWEVIENGNTAPKTIVVEGVEKLKFNSIKDAKLLMEAVEKRFGGNAATLLLSWAKVDSDYQLAQGLQVQEQEELTDEEKARTDLVEGSSKRAGTELEQEVTKKQKVDDVQETAEVDDDQEAAKIKELMEIVPDKRKFKDVLSLQSYAQKLLQRRFGNSVEIEDTIWRNQQDYRVLEWKLYDSIRSIEVGSNKRYSTTGTTRLKKIPKELRIQSALPAPVPEEASS